MKYIVSLLMLFAVGCSVAQAYDTRLRPDTWAKLVLAENLDNWYQVDEHVYRSEQPNHEAMVEVEKFGIKSVLNLRGHHDDEDEVSETNLVTYHVPLRASDINDENVVTALNIMRQAEKPVLVHCWHGADRTGAIIAMYRIIEQGWRKQEAISELIEGGYHYHAKFANIITYIQEVDVDNIKRKLNQKDNSL